MIVSHINNFITTWSQCGFSALKSSQSLHNRSIAYLVLKIVLNTRISMVSPPFSEFIKNRLNTSQITSLTIILKYFKEENYSTENNLCVFNHKNI